MSTKLLATVREQIKSKVAEREQNAHELDVRNTSIDKMLESCEREVRDLDDAETKRFNELREQVDDIMKRQKDLDAEIEGLEARESSLKAHEEARAAAEDMASKWADPAPEPRSVGGAKITREARTYNPDAERRGVSFFRDLVSHRFDGDPGAGDRIVRHMREARVEELAGYEQRAVGTGAFAGLTVPQYLTDLVAPLARAGAPTVQICNRHSLPADGMTVNISRITTGTAVTAQSTDGQGVQNTDADDTLLTVNVRTYAGQQVVSRQAIERGTGIDDVLVQDLVRAYWTKLDSDIVNGAGTLGTHTGVINTGSIQSVAYTDTTATVAEAYPKFADLIQKVQSGVYTGITHWVMHPRRWWWMAKELSSTVPLITVPAAGTQQIGSLGGADYNTTAASLLGVPVVLDANIPTTNGAGTNEDVILGVSAPELHLWHDEGAPLFIRAEQTDVANLQVRFVVYQYSAFTAGRYPGAHGKIAGTGLTTPTF